VQAEKDQLASTTEKTVRSARRRPSIWCWRAVGHCRPADAKELAAKGELKSSSKMVSAGNAGCHDEAIEKFNAGVAINPKCYDCYDNIGFAHMQKKYTTRPRR
jgi:hypothetical protein